MAKTQAVLETDDGRTASLFLLNMPLLVLALTFSCLHDNRSHKLTTLPEGSRDMTVEMRVARPTDHLDLVVEMYRNGLGFEKLGSFEDHQGFDGVMLGKKGSGYHPLIIAPTPTSVETTRAKSAKSRAVFDDSLAWWSSSYSMSWK